MCVVVVRDYMCSRVQADYVRFIDGLCDSVQYRALEPVPDPLVAMRDQVSLHSSARERICVCCPSYVHQHARAHTHTHTYTHAHVRTHARTYVEGESEKKVSVERRRLKLRARPTYLGVANG